MPDRNKRYHCAVCGKKRFKRKLIQQKRKYSGWYWKCADFCKGTSLWYRGERKYQTKRIMKFNSG